MTAILRLCVLGLAVASVMSGCAPTVLSRTLPGGKAAAYGVEVSTRATVSARGEVQSVSVILPYAATVGASTMHDMIAHPPVLAVPFPQPVKDQTFFDHFEMDWMPMGHEPARYGTPHFDFHFYGVDPAAVAAVDCRNPAQPDPAVVPVGWATPVPPGLPDPTVMCVPQMGYHAIPLTEFSAPGEFHAGVFDQVMITGFYGGQLTFIEPMVTQAALERKADFTLPVPQPIHARATRFPRSFKATYDVSADTSTLTFVDFTPIS